MDDSEEPQGPGRRALPADETGGSTVAPRRGVPTADEMATPPGPRRAAPTTEGDEVQPWFRGPGAWVVLVASVLIALALWSMMQPTSEPPPVVIVPTSAAPTATDTGPTDSPSPSDDTNPGTATTPDPSESAPPLPATAAPAPPVSVPPEPSPDSSATAGLVELNDANFMGATGWTLYGDDLIEEDRRAVRLSNEATDTRLQAVTLLPGGGELSESCGSLVELQQTQFTEVTRQLVTPIGVETTLGAGVRCGFSGVRSSDGVANTVSFTLVSRASDSHVLMLRTTVPDALPAESPAIAQLLSMSCQASVSFGVTLPLC